MFSATVDVCQQLLYFLYTRQRPYSFISRNKCLYFFLCCKGVVVRVALLVCEYNKFVDYKFEYGERFDFLYFIFANDSLGFGFRDANLMHHICRSQALQPYPYRLNLILNLFIQHFIYCYIALL